MAKFKGMIRPGGLKKPKKPKGINIKRRQNVGYRKAEGTGEPLRAARLLAGY